MIINIISIVLTVLGLMAMAKSNEFKGQHSKKVLAVMYVFGTVIAFITWNRVLTGLWWVVSTPIKFIAGLL